MKVITEYRASGARPNAWLLDFGGGHRAAVGARVLLHLIENPEIHAVPSTPAHCRHVVHWQDRLLAVMDMAARLGAEPRKPRLLAVTCYREPSEDSIRFGALVLAAPPVPLVVADAPRISLPEQPSAWSELAVSCFDHLGAPIPILHMSRIFSEPDQL